MNKKRIAATIAVSVISLGSLTACSGANPLSGYFGSPEKMCEVLEESKAEFEAEYGKPEEMGIEDIERLTDPAFLQEVADKNVEVMKDIEAAAPNEIKDDASAAVTEAEEYAQLDFSNREEIANAPATPAAERVYDYLQDNGCTVIEY